MPHVPMSPIDPSAQDLRSDEIRLPITVDLVCQYGGATRNPNGTLTFAPPSIALPAAELTFGDQRLGRWVLDSIDHSSRSGIGQYYGTFRRVGE